MAGLVSLLAKGGFVMIPLLACSILALAVVLERAWFWWRSRDSMTTERVLTTAVHGQAALAGAEASRSLVARVLAAGLRHRNPAPTLAMEAAAREETGRLTRYLSVLDTIITLSPLLGLLGTVTGMIGAFGVMAETGINQPHAITGGVAEALIATASGLAVAIAALVPYNYFLRRAERTLEEIERSGLRLELLLREREAAER